METAVAVRNGGAIAPMSFENLKAMGQVFEQSGAFGFSQQGQGIVVAMTCVMQNMTPLEFMERYNIIGGKPSMKADAMLANLLELGGTYEILARDANRAGIKATYKAATISVTLSWDEAKQEPFVYTDKTRSKIKYNWETPRARMQMLWARVVSDAVRAVCPLANRGSYTPEEMQDLRDDDAPATTSKTIVLDPSQVTIGDAKGTDSTPPPPPAEKKPAKVKKTEPAAAPAPAATEPTTTPAATETRSNTEPPKSEVITPEVMPKPAVDVSMMPIGKQAGVKWTAMSDGALAKVLTIDQNQYPEITDAHKAAVQAEIERRKSNGQI